MISLLVALLLPLAAGYLLMSYVMDPNWPEPRWEAVLLKVFLALGLALKAAALLGGEGGG
jgi:hypothetical protein